MKNVIKTVLVKKIKQYRFLIKYRVEKRNKMSYESCQNALKILDLRKNNVLIYRYTKDNQIKKERLVC